MVDSKTGELFVLGLTGGIASGKSAASQFLKGLGANVIDAVTALLHLNSARVSVAKMDDSVDETE